MNTKILTSTAIAALFALGASGAMAAGVNANAGVNASTDLSTGVNSSTGMKAGTDINANGSMGASTDQMNTWNKFVSDLKMGAAADTNAITNAKSVQIVDVATLQGQANGSADLNALIKDNKTSVDNLQASIRDNSTVQSKLQAQGLKTANVVAADTQTDGTLVLYVSKNA